ncbi:MAG: hypothetical protein G01um10147_456 [Microgenomates group bacterium Gr01-1014_7]|nr:MAG: hypothetical protein G01um10147_456 [Microgenomates group bacterium Gr01-1014_7]
MKVMRLLIKFLILPLILMSFFNFLEYGFEWNRPDQFIYPIVLTLVTLIIFFVSKLRKLFLSLSLSILFLMIFLYLLNELNLANIIGSFGFALLLIVISSYIPQIIKEGFVEKF